MMNTCNEHMWHIMNTCKQIVIAMLSHDHHNIKQLSSQNIIIATGRVNDSIPKVNPYFYLSLK